MDELPLEPPELVEPELFELPQHMLELELLVDTADMELTLELEPPLDPELEEVPHEMAGLPARRCRPNADAS